ncbi:MAG: hypothetical protein A2540_01945 [Sulfurimonas sp. RIFOXYD2_FULL_37_8]|jgi:hypothetical protein|nr:MAG: hypothetical protein A2540_01945 [Sulfurimonas sp. RIFOXYD2_FULL_37_8]
MKQLFLLFVIALELFGAAVKSPVVGIDEDAAEVTIKVENVEVGVSGFIVHEIDKDHTIILKNAVVKSYDKNSKIAKVAVSEFNALSNSALPNGKWKVKIGDTAVLAFGYTRGILIAPNEDIYYRITKNSKLQWVHPDLFATTLSYNSHPTPLRSDFDEISTKSSIGLLFIYLDGKVFTLDAKSFKILTITEAKLEQKEVNLPFYTRVPEIDSSWWKFFDKGNEELEEYEPHYYSLLAEANPQDKALYEIIKNGGDKVRDLLKEFKIKE